MEENSVECNPNDEIPIKKKLKFQVTVTFEIDQEQLQDIIEKFSRENEFAQNDAAVLPINLIINSKEEPILYVGIPPTNEPGRITTSSGGAR